MTLLSCWILITLLNFDTFLSRNSTGRRYVDGSEFHVELWPLVKIQRWIMTPGQNSTFNCDPNPRSQFNVGSQFNVESRTGVTMQHGIKDRGHNSTWNHDPGSQIHVKSWSESLFKVESWPGVTIQRWIMTPGQSSILNCDPNPGSQLNVESWLGVTIQCGIKTWGHNSTWNIDPGSQFNGGPNFIRRRGRSTMTPVSWGRNSTWKPRWILSTARWIKTPRVEIQWGQTAILHRHVYRGFTVGNGVFLATH